MDAPGRACKCKQCTSGTTREMRNYSHFYRKRYFPLSKRLTERQIPRKDTSPHRLPLCVTHLLPERLLSHNYADKFVLSFLPEREIRYHYQLLYIIAPYYYRPCKIRPIIFIKYMHKYTRTKIYSSVCLRLENMLKIIRQESHTQR